MNIDKRLQDFRKEVEKLKEIDGAEEYAKQLAHLFLGNGLSLQTILLMAIDFGQQHPHWIPVEKELPKHDVEDNGLITYPNVLVCLYDGFRDESYYDDIRGEWGDYDGEVEYWMPMPVPPRKEEEGVSCYNCKNYEPWGGLGDATLQHYCGKDGQIGVICNPSESENCNGYKPRKED